MIKMKSMIFLLCICVICADMTYYPRGSWVETAKNPRLDRNLLCADLAYYNVTRILTSAKNLEYKNEIDAGYKQSCILINRMNVLINENGQFKAL